MDTIPSRFARQASLLPDKPLFLVNRGGSYQSLPWKQAHEAITALSLFFLDQQIKPGDRVLILSENRPEWGIADVAIQSVGAWTVPIYPTLTANDLEMIGRDCEPVFAVTSTTEQAGKLLEVCRAAPSLRGIVVIEPSAQADPRIQSWSAALSRGRDAAAHLVPELERRLAAIHSEDTATLLYTSGTTGEPKGVMLSHRNLLSNVDACLKVIPIGPQDVHLSFLPLSHVFERMAGWYLMFSVGASVAYAQSMDTLPQDMVAVRPTVMLGVPRFFEKLYARIQEGLQHAPPLQRRIAEWAFGVGRTATGYLTSGRPLPLRLAWQRHLAQMLVYRKLQARLGGRLRFFVSGSAPLSKDIGAFFYSAGVTILEGYGLTETSPVIAANRLPAPRFGTVGPALPGVDVRIAEDGEILTRGPHVMQGYYRKPDATAAAIVDGWFHTGDIGHVDAEGNLVITDRKKDLIKTAGGKFVAPQKLENAFVMDPAISQAFVYGDRRPYCVALIVPNQEQMRRYAREQGIPAMALSELVRDPRVVAWYWVRVQAKQAGFASFEQVKKIALLDAEFSQAAGELTPTLKAKRSVIAQRYAALLDRLYEASLP